MILPAFQTDYSSVWIIISNYNEIKPAPALCKLNALISDKDFTEKRNRQTFQRRFNVVFRLIWRRDVAQRQINVETTLCTTTLKFTTFNNVETTLCISTLNWTTFGNIKTRLSFSTSIFTALGNVETTSRIWPFGKKN